MEEQTVIMKKMEMSEAGSEGHGDPSCSCLGPGAAASQRALFLAACSCDSALTVYH